MVREVEDNWEKFERLKEYEELKREWMIEWRSVMKKNGKIWVIG